MESMIAELVLSGNLYKRSDFVIMMCNRLDYNLLNYKANSAKGWRRVNY